MEKFKEGDYVKMKGSCSGCKTGEVYKLYYGNKDGKDNLDCLFARPLDNLENGCMCEMLWEKVEFNFKRGDKVIYYERIIGYYVDEDIIEREDGEGWGRDTAIPDDYVAISSNTYWRVIIGGLKHCPKEEILEFGLRDILITGTYSNTLNSTGQLTKENIDRAIEALKVNSKNTMSNITKFVKESLLSGEEKLLRKHGFKTECGDYTSEGQSFAIALICKEKEAQMIEVAKGLEEATKNK